MKRILFFICLLSAGIMFANAQEKSDANKMIQDRMSYMKDNLKLSSTESKTFWNAYEQFLRSEVKYHDTFRSNLNKQGINPRCPKCTDNCETMTDKQITYLYDQRFELEKNLYMLESNFYKKVKTILTPKHIHEFYKLDEKFKRELINKKSNKDVPNKGTAPASTPTKKKR